MNLIVGEKKIFISKSHRTNGQNLLLLTKGYISFCIFISLEQLFLVPTRVTSKTTTLLDQVLPDSSEEVHQCGVIESGISDHDLV